MRVTAARFRLLTRGGCCAGLLVLMLALPGVAQAALSWSAPVVIDHARAFSLTAVACASAEQ
jgi:hypothetical protein